MTAIIMFFVGLAELILGFGTVIFTMTHEVPYPYIIVLSLTGGMLGGVGFSNILKSLRTP